MDRDEVLLEVKNLSKQFNVEAGFFSRNKKVVYAVNDVSFNVKKGETYGIVGESGCGKTTTVKIIINLFEKSSGSILFQGKEISDFSKKELKLFREQVKYIFQDPARSLNPRLSVFDVLIAGLKYSSQWKGKEAARALAEKIIQEVGLSKEDLDRRPSEFSGGQRQRISIARGLIMNPKLMLCDEVVSALDVSVQGQIINLLQDLKKSRDLSFIFITHDLKVASYFCDKIGVMFRGVLVEEAPAEFLYKNSCHPYTKMLFDGASGTLSDSAVEVKTTLEKENCCPFAYRCPKAQSKCFESLPEFSEISPEHKVRCFYN